MNEPWFDPAAFAWIPGTLFGCLAGAWGALAETLAPRGKGKPLILGAAVFLSASAVLLLVAAVAALLAGQPYGVWYGLGLPGLLGMLLIPLTSPAIWLAYRAAENRRMAAHDL